MEEIIKSQEEEPNELGFREWRDKLIERLTMTKVNEENGVDSCEADMEILKALHDYVWHPGAIIFYEVRSAGSVETAEQGMLFGQNDTSSEPNP